MKLLLSILLSFTIVFGSTQVFVSCEGNYYDGNQGTLWIINDNDVYGYPGNPIGSIAQSLYVYEDLLFVALNGSSSIQIYEISEFELTLLQTVNTVASGPREMVVTGDYLYFTNWFND